MNYENLEIVICENNEKMKENICCCVHQLFLSTDLEYKIYLFNEENLDLKKLIEKKRKKMYILDLVLDKGSGLNIGRNIRASGDWESVIIILTSYPELHYIVYKDRLMILDFILKNENYLEILKEDILIGEKILTKEEKERSYIIIQENKLKVKLFFDEILFLEKEKERNAVYIYTLDHCFKVYNSLNNIKKDLDENFYFSHRSCIVNASKIKMIDYKKNEIIFADKKKTQLLSRKGKIGLDLWYKNLERGAE